VNDLGRLGRVWREADYEDTNFETIVAVILSGEYKAPIGIFRFNVAEGWSRDVSDDVANELRRHCDLEERDLPENIRDFVERHENILGAASTGSRGDERSDIGIASAMLAVLHTSTVVTGNLFHRSSPDNALETARADPRLRRIIGRHLRALERRAERLVTEQRDAIVAVADELVRTRHLSGDAVRAIVERARGRTISH
jgi:hypothetical protein